MSEIADRYRRLADAFGDTVAAVPPDRWTSDSPCADWTARDVLEHVCSTQGMFLGFIDESAADAPAVADDPTGAWRAASAPVAAALSDPARATTTFEGFFGETTFESAVDRFLNFDLVVHRWDLARATGGDTTIPPADAERVIAGAEGLGPALYSDGVCAPAIPVAEDAPVATRMLAMLGRRA